MQTLSILSRKGGTGKTTLATHLSVAAERAVHTPALIDREGAIQDISQKRVLGAFSQGFFSVSRITC